MPLASTICSSHGGLIDVVNDAIDVVVLVYLRAAITIANKDGYMMWKVL